MKTELLKKWNVGIVAGCLAMGVSNAQTITNGSLNGSVGMSSIPAGWSNHAGTTLDTASIANVIPSSTVEAVTIPDSSDGGTWVGGVPGEAMTTSITDLVIGQDYTIAWEHTNLGFEASSAWQGLTEWNFHLNGVLTHTTDPIPLSGTWINDNFTFTAIGTSTTLRVSLNRAPGEARNSYSSIDGFSITEVPEPSSTALLGLSALGLLVRRKR